MKNLLSGFLLLSIASLSVTAFAAPPKKGAKAQFYDFREQLIDGKIQRPADMLVSPRQKVKFDRLLKLKKSFLTALLHTSKERVFK